nr:DUF4942 domain-containing protein [Scandinavium hiltneri]
MRVHDCATRSGSEPHRQNVVGWCKVLWTTVVANERQVPVVHNERPKSLVLSPAGIRDNPSKDVYEDDFFSIRYFQKGTAHITFKRYDLTEKMNDIVAKHYPGMLAAR